MQLPFLYVVVNVDRRESILGFIRGVFGAGVELIQLRAKEMKDSELLAIARQVVLLRDEIAPTARVLINDRPEVCIASGADGVHVGQNDSSPVEVRALLGDEVLVGFSTHTAAQLANVPQEVLSYAALGPIYLSPTKQGHADVVGVEQLRLWRAKTSLPLVAIGGIKAENAKEVYEAGADCIAVISDIEHSPHIADRVQQYRVAFEKARGAGE